MRMDRPCTKLWVKASALRQARYSEIIRKNDGVLPDRYFEDVEKRRSAAAGLRLITCVIQVPIFVFFVLSLIPVESSSFVFGALSKDLREILIVVSAALGLCISVIGYYHDALTEILAAHVEYRSNGNKSVEEMLRLSYGIDIFPLPPRTQGHLELGWGYLLFVRIFTAFTAVTVIVLALSALFIRLKVLEDIYFTPTFSTAASLWVIGFVVITDTLGAFIFILNTGPIRARRFEEETTSNRPSTDARESLRHD
jgi:hypothetical protein